MSICIVEALGWCIPSYVFYGILLFIVGLLISVFLPVVFAKKLGLVLIIIGLVLAVGISLLADFWANSQTFRLIVYGFFVLAILITILFPDTKVPFVNKN